MFHLQKYGFRALNKLSKSSRQSLLSRFQVRNALPITYPFPWCRNIWIRSETTPNDNALMFVPDVNILPPEVSTLEFMSPKDAKNSELARKLFDINGVGSLLFGKNFITVNKDADMSWGRLKPEIFSVIMEHLSNGEPVIDGTPFNPSADTQILDSDSETVAMIKELIDSSIRPSIQEDGGDLEYRGFDEQTGTVYLKLRGSCRTCASSEITLKSGIQQMLMHYIPEVKNVEQQIDPEEEVAIEEFEKFEKKLREQKKQPEKENKEKEKTK